MARKLAYNVHLEDENGTPFVFGPEDTVPAWAKKKITNPSAWAGDENDDEGDDVSTVGSRQASSEANGGSQGGGGDTEAVYGELTKADLNAEIDRRNTNREEADQIKPGGKKNDDLIAALKADDQAATA